MKFLLFTLSLLSLPAEAKNCKNETEAKEAFYQFKLSAVEFFKQTSTSENAEKVFNWLTCINDKIWLSNYADVGCKFYLDMIPTIIKDKNAAQCKR